MKLQQELVNELQKMKCENTDRRPSIESGMNIYKLCS